MNTKLFLVAALAAMSFNSYGQVLLFEDFDSDKPSGLTANQLIHYATAPVGTLTGLASGRTITGCTTASGGWYTGNSGVASGRTITYNTTSLAYSAFLSVAGSTTTNLRASTTSSLPLSAIGSSFNPVLTDNTDLITWEFAIRLNRTGGGSTLANSFKAGASPAYAGGLIVATDAVDNQPISTQTTTSGYMVLYHGVAPDGTTVTGNAISLVSFTGGLNENTKYVKLATVEGLETTGNYSSVILTYDPKYDSWALKVRNDAATGINLQDPEVSNTKSYVNATKDPVIDNTYTGLTMTNMMMYFNFSGTNACILDKLRVRKGAVPEVPVLSVAKNEIEGLKVYPNPVVDGKLFIGSNSSEAKKVTIYSVLGKEVLNKEVSSDFVDVSNIAAGVYILKIAQEGKTSTVKIAIK